MGLTFALIPLVPKAMVIMAAIRPLNLAPFCSADEVAVVTRTKRATT
jgi:hypothetical protein